MNDKFDISNSWSKSYKPSDFAHLFKNKNKNNSKLSKSHKILPKAYINKRSKSLSSSLHRDDVILLEDKVNDMKLQYSNCIRRYKQKNLHNNNNNNNNNNNININFDNEYKYISNIKDILNKTLGDINNIFAKQLSIACKQHETIYMDIQSMMYRILSNLTQKTSKSYEIIRELYEKVISFDDKYEQQRVYYENKIKNLELNMNRMKKLHDDEIKQIIKLSDEKINKAVNESKAANESIIVLRSLFKSLKHQAMKRIHNDKDHNDETPLTKQLQQKNVLLEKEISDIKTELDVVKLDNADLQIQLELCKSDFFKSRISNDDEFRLKLCKLLNVPYTSATLHSWCPSKPWILDLIRTIIQNRLILQTIYNMKETNIPSIGETIMLWFLSSHRQKSIQARSALCTGILRYRGASDEVKIFLKLLFPDIIQIPKQYQHYKMNRLLQRLLYKHLSSYILFALLFLRSKYGFPRANDKSSINVSVKKVSDLIHYSFQDILKVEQRHSILYYCIFDFGMSLDKRWEHHLNNNEFIKIKDSIINNEHINLWKVLLKLYEVTKYTFINHWFKFFEHLKIILKPTNDNDMIELNFDELIDHAHNSFVSYFPVTNLNYNEIAAILYNASMDRTVNEYGILNKINFYSLCRTILDKELIPISLHLRVRPMIKTKEHQIMLQHTLRREFALHEHENNQLKHLNNYPLLANQSKNYLNQLEKTLHGDINIRMIEYNWSEMKSCYVNPVMKQIDVTLCLSAWRLYSSNYLLLSHALSHGEYSEKHLKELQNEARTLDRQISGGNNNDTRSAKLEKLISVIFARKIARHWKKFIKGKHNAYFSNGIPRSFWKYFDNTFAGVPIMFKSNIQKHNDILLDETCKTIEHIYMNILNNLIVDQDMISLCIDYFIRTYGTPKSSYRQLMKLFQCLDQFAAHSKRIKSFARLIGHRSGGVTYNSKRGTFFIYILKQLILLLNGETINNFMIPTKKWYIGKSIAHQLLQRCFDDLNIVMNAKLMVKISEMSQFDNDTNIKEGTVIHADELCDAMTDTFLEVCELKHKSMGKAINESEFSSILEQNLECSFDVFADIVCRMDASFPENKLPSLFVKTSEALWNRRETNVIKIASTTFNEFGVNDIEMQIINKTQHCIGNNSALIIDWRILLENWNMHKKEMKCWQDELANSLDPIVYHELQSNYEKLTNRLHNLESLSHLNQTFVNNSWRLFREYNDELTQRMEQVCTEK